MSEVSHHEQPRSRGGRGVTGAIILIAIGVVFLLNNMGILSVSWMALLRFWPVILVLIGLDLIFARTALGSVLVALAGLLVVGGIIYYASSMAPPDRPMILSGNTITREIEGPNIGDVDRIEATIDLGAADAQIDVMPGGSRSARSVVSGQYRTDEDLSLNVEYNVSGSEGRLSVTQEGSATNIIPFGTSFVGTIDLSLTDAVPLALDVNAGVGSFTLDLTGMQNLQSLTVDGGVGDMTIILPEVGEFPVNINVGIGNVRLVVPAELEAQITSDNGLTHFNIASRFNEESEDLYITSGYQSATNRATIEIDTGIGNVRIE